MSVLRALGGQSSINVRKVLWTREEIGIDYVQEDWGTGFASVPHARCFGVSGDIGRQQVRADIQHRL